MLLLRSLLFNVAFFGNTVLWLIGLLFLLPLPRRRFFAVIQQWGAFSVWLLRVLAGIRVEYRHAERIPPGGLLVAAKHQSTLETFALLPCFSDPTFILKRELMWLPLFGWFAAKSGMVPVDRRKGSAALADMLARARDQAEHGRQVVIFPEGTRRAPGAPPGYRQGVGHLYEALGMPCLPVALNSGLYWPRRRFLRLPGTVVIEFLEPIPPGLPREEARLQVEARIEAASARLLEEGRAELAANGHLAEVAAG